MFVNQNYFKTLTETKKITGVLFIVFALLFSSLGKTYSSERVEKGPAKTMADASSEEEAPGHTAVFDSFSFEAVIPFVQVDLSNDLYLLLEKPFIILSYKPIHFEKISLSGRYFKTLFYYIISPNAP
jgi:hypothetical protein